MTPHEHIVCGAFRCYARCTKYTFERNIGGYPYCLCGHTEQIHKKEEENQ